MNYFSTKKTATLLGYNDDSYVRKLISQGKINAEKRGRGWVVSQDEIQKYQIINTIASKHKALLSFNQELHIAIEDLAQSKPQREIGPKDAITAFSLTKGYKTHGAIIQLCKSGFGEDASILVRSLFELSITLLYVLQEPSEERAYRYMSYDWILRKKMFDQAISNNPELLQQFNERRLNPKKMDNSLEEITKMANLVQEKYGYRGNTWSDKSLRDMAISVGRGHAYDTVYRLHSQNVHSQPRAMNSYASRTSEGLTYLLAESEQWVEEALVASFDFMYSIVGAVDKHFEWGAESKLDNIAERYWRTLTNINEEANK